MTRPAALVLCGGQSSRMGKSKALLPFGPEVLLQRVVRILRDVADPIVVVAAPDQELPDLPDGVVVVSDPVAHQGPLQGLASGLGSLPETVEFAFVTATDAPFLRPEWVTTLTGLIGGDDLAMPFVDGYYHPLAALYRRGPVLAAVRSLLAAGRHRPVFLLEALPSRVVTRDELFAADPTLATLRNLNTPDDYHEALLQAGSEPD